MSENIGITQDPSVSVLVSKIPSYLRIVKEQPTQEELFITGVGVSCFGDLFSKFSSIQKAHFYDNPECRFWDLWSASDGSPGSQ